MEYLKKVSDVVKKVLQTVPEARSNDKLLYFSVCKEINGNALEKPFGLVLLNLEEYALPNIETVTRARRKLQSEYPELSANKKTKYNRTQQEQKFKSYAKAVNV